MGAEQRTQKGELHAPMLEHVFEPAFVWRLGGGIVFWNDGARRLYGFTKEEAFGRVTHELLRTEFAGGTRPEEVEAALRRQGTWSGELVHRTKEGQRVVVDARMRVAALPEGVRPATGGGEAGELFVMETNRDITERQRVEREAVVWARQQERVAGLWRMSLEDAALDAMLGEAVRQVADELGVEHVEVWGVSPDDGRAVLRAGAGWLRESCGAVELAELAGPQAAFTVAAGEPIVVSDLAAETRFRVPRRLIECGAAAALSVVIRAQPQVTGALVAYARRAREFSRTDVAFARAVANVVAAAVRSDASARALREGAERMRAVLETVIEGIVTIDERGIIESINPAACGLFGYAREELVGRNVNVLMPEPYRTEHDGYLDNYVRTGRARIIGIGREVTGRRKDGSVFPLDLGVSEFNVGGRRMFAGVLRDVTEQRRLEREILEATAQEQLRIGQDLHDGLCQELTGITFALEVLGQKLANRAAPETAGIRKVAELVDQSISHARALAHGLQPVKLDASGLAAALRELASKVERMFRVSCLFVSESEVLVHDNVVATHVFRIAQEAITNAVKHGKAKTIVVDLTGDEDGWLRLTVSDDGVGLAAKGGAGAPHGGGGKGIGMQTMQYRARVVGGRLDVRPGERGGTVVECAVPLRGVVIDEGVQAAERSGAHGEDQQDEVQAGRRSGAAGRNGGGGGRDGGAGGGGGTGRGGGGGRAGKARGAKTPGVPRGRPPHGPGAAG